MYSMRPEQAVESHFQMVVPWWGNYRLYLYSPDPTGCNHIACVIFKYSIMST